MMGTVLTVRAMTFRSIFHTLPKVSHLLLVKVVKLFELFGSQDTGKGLHSVDAAFQQRPVYIENACLGGIDSGRILTFKSLAQSPFGLMFLLTEDLENGIAFHAASLDGRLLFRCHLQQGIHGGKVRAFEFRTLVKVAMRTRVLVFAIFMLGAVRTAARLSILFARAR